MVGGSGERTVLHVVITCEISGRPESIEVLNFCEATVTDAILGAETGGALKSFFGKGEKDPLIREAIMELSSMFMKRMSVAFGFYPNRVDSKEGP